MTRAKAKPAIRIKGYRLQVASKTFTCDGCKGGIEKGQDYVRVVRTSNKIEVFDVDCFRDEFGIAPDAPLVG